VKTFWLKGIAFILAGAPILWLLLFYLFALKATVELGHWPIPSRDDPHGDFFHSSLCYTVYLSLFFAPAGVGVSMVALALDRSFTVRAVRISIFVAVVSVAALIGLYFTDPGNCFDWFTD